MKVKRQRKRANNEKKALISHSHTEINKLSGFDAPLELLIMTNYALAVSKLINGSTSALHLKHHLNRLRRFV